MIREVLAEAWAQSPWKVVAAVVLAPVVVAYGWALTGLLIVALS